MKFPAALAVAGTLTATLAFASGEPQESIAYQNFVRASEVLERAIAAHGGAKILDRSENLRLSVKGIYRAEGHFARPWAYRDYPFRQTLVYSAPLSALKSESTEETEKPDSWFVVVGPANGIEVAAGSSKPEVIPDKDLDNRLGRELELLPQEYLRQARARSAGLRLLASAGPYDVLHYTLENGETRDLYFDAKTHLLARVERIDHWELKGDRMEWRTFDGYADKGGRAIPARSELHKERESTQTLVTTEIVSIEVGGEVKPDELSIPAAFRSGYETWTLEAKRAPKTDDTLAFHDLGKGAYVLDIPVSDSRALLVAFADFAVVVEAGDRSDVGEKILKTADRILPGKPVRYVAMTHHHPLYANGLRPYVQRGATVLVTPGNVAYYRDLATRPYRIRPDEQQRRPQEPKLEVIEGKRVIEDKAQRLELYEFDYSTHTDEYVLPYLPSHKLIVTGDMVYLLRKDEPGKAASSRERAIERVIAENKLDVETILQTWFLESSDRLTPYSRLEEKLKR